MNKEVMISIQSYYVFLIIARLMGWDIPQYKKVEVRKDFPKDKYWNKKVHIYCSKSKKSFNRIPKEYQPLMRPFLGKVIGEFICDKITMSIVGYKNHEPCYWTLLDNSGLSKAEIMNYGKWKTLYGWQISELKIYDKPKELSEFKKQNPCYEQGSWEELGCWESGCTFQDLGECDGRCSRLTRPPQSWCYVEEL